MAVQVMGCEDGVVRCFDADCKALGWNEDLDAGSITSISFATLVRGLIPMCCSIAHQLPIGARPCGSSPARRCWPP